jgi:hypothetical protein
VPGLEAADVAHDGRLAEAEPLAHALARGGGLEHRGHPIRDEMHGRGAALAGEVAHPRRDRHHGACVAQDLAFERLGRTDQRELLVALLLAAERAVHLEQVGGAQLSRDLRPGVAEEGVALVDEIRRDVGEQLAGLVAQPLVHVERAQVALEVRLDDRGIALERRPRGGVRAARADLVHLSGGARGAALAEPRAEHPHLVALRDERVAELADLHRAAFVAQQRDVHVRAEEADPHQDPPAAAFSAIACRSRERAMARS